MLEAVVDIILVEGGGRDNNHVGRRHRRPGHVRWGST
jgi:hypothetical protein